MRNIIIFIFIIGATLPLLGQAQSQTTVIIGNGTNGWQFVRSEWGFPPDSVKTWVTDSLSTEGRKSQIFGMYMPKTEQGYTSVFWKKTLPMSFSTENIDSVMWDIRPIRILYPDGLVPSRSFPYDSINFMIGLYFWESFDNSGGYESDTAFASFGFGDARVGIGRWQNFSIPGRHFREHISRISSLSLCFNLYDEALKVQPCYGEMMFDNLRIRFKDGTIVVIERFGDGGITSVESNPVTENVPEEFTLFQNYPNPFNPSTTIRFGISSPSRVTLQVYDMLGREVAVLVDEIKPTGIHTVRFDAHSQPSGAYLYRLKVGDLTKSRTMLLVK